MLFATHPLICLSKFKLQTKDLSNRIAILELQSEDLSNRIAVWLCLGRVWVCLGCVWVCLGCVLGVSGVCLGVSGAPQDQKSTNRASSCNLAREICQDASGAC